MPSDSAIALIAKYKFYEEAQSACHKIGFESTNRDYPKQADFARDVMARVGDGFNSTRLADLLNAAGRKLHDSTFSVWVECIDENIRRFTNLLNRYSSFVEPRRVKLRALKLAPIRQIYSQILAAETGRFEILKETPPAHNDYIAADWNTSFDDLRKINDTLFNAFKDMWKWITDGESEQTENSKTAISRIRLALAVVGSSGVGGFIAAHWDAIRHFLIVVAGL